MARGRTGGGIVTVPADPAALRCRPFGDRAFLVEPLVPDGPGADALLGAADAARGLWPGATVVPGLGSVLVTFAAPSLRPVDLDEACARLGAARLGRAEVAPAGASTPDGPVRILTRYDGPDLGDVASALGVPVAELVARHASAEWTVAAIGFSPGFGYLRCPDPLFHSVSRRPAPRSRVPAGSVALAAGMCAVYPSATPGGWQLIGTTSQVLFDVRADPPALLAPGDRVEFRIGS